MNGKLQLVIFRLDDLRCALPLAKVERAVRAVEITRLPGAPEVVLGVVNVQGRIVPVFNTRRRFALPERDVRLEDQMLLARTAVRTVALLVDTVEGLFQCEDTEATPADRVWSGIGHVVGVVKRSDGLILIHNLDTFLSADEHHAMEQALIAEPCAP